MEDPLVDELLELKWLFLPNRNSLVGSSFNLELKCKLEVLLLSLTIKEKYELFFDLEAVLFLALPEVLLHVSLLDCFKDDLPLVA